MRAEEAVHNERGKAQRLQAELDTSEQVQRDFVKLSQSLQVLGSLCPYSDRLASITGIRLHLSLHMDLQPLDVVSNMEGHCYNLSQQLS